MKKIIYILLAATITTAAALTTTTASAHPHHITKRLTNGPWNIWEDNGTQAVGASDLNAGTSVTEVTHPGRTMTWVQEGIDPSGDPFGEWRFSNGNYMASNETCTGVTIKTDKTSDGTVWYWVVRTGGTLQEIESRYCQNNFANDCGNCALAGKNINGHQWQTVSDIADGWFRDIQLHTP